MVTSKGNPKSKYLFKVVIKTVEQHLWMLLLNFYCSPYPGIYQLGGMTNQNRTSTSSRQGQIYLALIYLIPLTEASGAK